MPAIAKSSNSYKERKPIVTGAQATGGQPAIAGISATARNCHHGRNANNSRDSSITRTPSERQGTYGQQ
jgi:hypothetical protein